MHKVFVYGTLKEGCGNHGLLINSEQLSMDVNVTGRLYSLGGFPGIKPAQHDAVRFRKAGSVVRGELYSVNDETLASLDRLEGHPRMYRRIIVPIFFNDTIIDKGWVYFYNGSVEEPNHIPRGFWQPH